MIEGKEALYAYYGITDQRPTAEQLATFAADCNRLGLSTPAPVTRAVELLKVGEAHAGTAPAMRLLEASDAEARTWITDRSIRGHDRDGIGRTRGLRAGVLDFNEQLLSEVQATARPHLDAIVTELQPRFDEVVAALHVAAQEFGFTYATTSDQVINRADEAASAAWRGVRAAWASVQALAAFRISMARTFREPPASQSSGGNHSVLFAAGNNWSREDGYLLGSRGDGAIDWLALAADGLHLNTPTEVAAKLSGPNTDD